MKRWIHFGHIPSRHHIGVLIESRGTLKASVISGTQLIIAGLLMPLSYLCKIPICLNVKPIGYRKPKLFFTYKLWRLRRKVNKYTHRKEKP